MVILDTNIIIDHLRQKAGSPTLLKSLIKKHSRKSLAISVITIQELFTGQSTKLKHNQTLIAKTIANIKTYNLTPSIAHRAGELMRDHNKLKFADAAIAATAIHYHSSLATLNTKDFKNIPNLPLLPTNQQLRTNN